MKVGLPQALEIFFGVYQLYKAFSRNGDLMLTMKVADFEKYKSSFTIVGALVSLFWVWNSWMGGCQPGALAVYTVGTAVQFSRGVAATEDGSWKTLRYRWWDALLWCVFFQAVLVWGRFYF